MQEQGGKNRSELRSIAVYQKAILVCILCNLGLFVGQLVIPPDLKFLLMIAYIVVSITSTVFVFLLATKVSGTVTGVVLGILTLIPCIGLIALLFINQKATSKLQQSGIRVGLLGASLSDV